MPLNPGAAEWEPAVAPKGAAPLPKGGTQGGAQGRGARPPAQTGWPGPSAVTNGRAPAQQLHADFPALGAPNGAAAKGAGNQAPAPKAWKVVASSGDAATSVGAPTPAIAAAAGGAPAPSRTAHAPQPPPPPPSAWPSLGANAPASALSAVTQALAPMARAPLHVPAGLGAHPASAWAHPHPQAQAGPGPAHPQPGPGRAIPNANQRSQLQQQPQQQPRQAGAVPGDRPGQTGPGAGRGGGGGGRGDGGRGSGRGGGRGAGEASGQAKPAAATTTTAPIPVPTAAAIPIPAPAGAHAAQSPGAGSTGSPGSQRRPSSLTKAFDGLAAAQQAAAAAAAAAAAGGMARGGAAPAANASLAPASTPATPAHQLAAGPLGGRQGTVQGGGSTPFSTATAQASPAGNVAGAGTGRPQRKASPLTAALGAAGARGAAAAAQAAILGGPAAAAAAANGAARHGKAGSGAGAGAGRTPGAMSAAFQAAGGAGFARASDLPSVSIPSPNGGGSSPGSAMTTPSQPITIRSRGSRQQLTMEDVMEAEDDEERSRRIDRRRRAAAAEAAAKAGPAAAGPAGAEDGAGGGGGGKPLHPGAGEESMNFEDGFDTHSVASRTSSIASRPSESLSYNVSVEAPSGTATAASGLAAAMDAAAAAAVSTADSAAAAAAAADAAPNGTAAAGGSEASASCTIGSAAVSDRSVREAQEEMETDGPVTCPKMHGVEEAAQRAAAAAAGVCLAPFSPPSRVGPQDFEMLRVVGQGAFGKVFQVMHKASRQVYAMKVMRKERILQRDHSEYVRSERDLLTAVVHPYIVTLRFSFQTPTKLYLVLDFLNGGHLFFNLYRQGVFSEDVARLYTAEIVLAIAYLHSRGIVHRDLKPENVLLDNEGHVRLTDFGLAKGNMGSEGDRTNSFIGTMEYMAPEIIEAKGHGKTVDWWSTGILMYEMLCGVPPFRAKSRQALQNQITSGKVKYPKFLSTDSQNLLKGLLIRDPARRLGAGPDGSDNVKRHPFFKQVNWAKLEARQVESKFKPTVSCNMDVGNFDKIWTDQPVVDSPCGTPTVASLGKFEGFTYVAPCFLNSEQAAAAVAGLAAVAEQPAAAAAAGLAAVPEQPAA